jgi:hypothetical protein
LFVVLPFVSPVALVDTSRFSGCLPLITNFKLIYLYDVEEELKGCEGGGGPDTCALKRYASRSRSTVSLGVWRAFVDEGELFGRVARVCAEGGKHFHGFEEDYEGMGYCLPSVEDPWNCVATVFSENPKLFATGSRELDEGAFKHLVWLLLARFSPTAVGGLANVVAFRSKEELDNLLFAYRWNEDVWTERLLFMGQYARRSGECSTNF